MEIKVRILSDGEVEILVDGVQGKACLQLTEKLEKQLGDVTDRKYTPEFYAKATFKQPLPQFVEQQK